MKVNVITASTICWPTSLQRERVSERVSERASEGEREGEKNESGF